MNAQEKAKILKANGYTYDVWNDYCDWYAGKELVGRDEDYVVATNTAYEHFLAAQSEATTQAANDAQGEAAYNEVVATANDHAVMNTLELEQACKELQAENEALEKRVAELEVELSEATRRFNALRRISEIAAIDSETAEAKLSSIRFVVKEALKPLSLFDWSKASDTEKRKAEQLALECETSTQSAPAEAPQCATCNDSGLLEDAKPCNCEAYGKRL